MMFRSHNISVSRYFTGDISILRYFVGGPPIRSCGPEPITYDTETYRPFAIGSRTPYRLTRAPHSKRAFPRSRPDPVGHAARGPAARVKSRLSSAAGRTHACAAPDRRRPQTIKAPRRRRLFFRYCVISVSVVLRVFFFFLFLLLTIFFSLARRKRY